MTAPLATPADLRDYSGAEFELTDARVLFLLDAASQVARTFTEQTLSYVADEEITIRVVEGVSAILLPQVPVVAVAEVTLDDELLVSLTDYIWTTSGRLVRLEAGANIPWAVWPAAGIVVVKYSHGYQTIPSDVKLAVIQMAFKMWSRPESSGALISETMGDYSYQLAQAGSVATLPGLTQDERRLLGPYRMVGLA